MAFNDIPIQKPTAAIFLDIDGVLMGDRFVDPLNRMIRQKLVDLFGKREEGYAAYKELEWRIAASHFLSKPAIESLEKLIEKVSEVAQVVIVLSSAWRLDGSVDEIKNQMLATCSFSKRIIDKTHDDDWWRVKNRQNPLSPIALEKYGYELSSRGNQIDYWLLENQDQWCIKSFVIIDDYDEKISERFPHNFVHVTRGLFSEEDAQKAYEIMTELEPDSLSSIHKQPQEKGYCSQEFLP